MGVREYERSPDRTDARHGFYNRDFVARLGTLRIWVARTRQRAFLPVGLARLECREAFLRGLSTRAVGRADLPTARHAAVRDLPELLAFFQCPRTL